jgi:hypothetical protein
MSSWQHHQERAKLFYSEKNYLEALKSYTEACNIAISHAPRKERSILLSNIVACRLQIGGSDNIALALNEAKECISLNGKWFKGHARLASVYIAMGNRSNDACQALQTAIRLDPSNSNARKLLMKELRRDHAHSSHNGQARNTSPTTREGNETMGNAESSSTDPSEAEEDIDDAGFLPANAQSWMQWIHEKLHETQSWYEDSNDNTKQLVKVGCFLLIVYIAFGGRFGLGDSSSNRHGNYGDNNAYDRFHNKDMQRDYNNPRAGSRRTYEHEYDNGGYNSYNDAKYTTDSYDHNSNSYRRSQSNHNSRNRRRNDYGMDYNVTALLSIVVILILRQVGVPIHLAPVMGLGMRGLGFGGGRMGGFGAGRMGGFGAGRMGHVNVGGFPIPLPGNRMFRRGYG